MDSLGNLLMIAGAIIAFIGVIRLIIEAFSTSVLWGLGILLFHPITIVFVLLHWSDAKGPFLNYIAGVILFFVGGVMAG